MSKWTIPTRRKRRIKKILLFHPLANNGLRNDTGKKENYFLSMSKKVSTFAPAFERQETWFSTKESAQVVELVDTLL